jgi:uncharacterized protein YfaS (alpha-2-macroglobulin family)
MAALDRGEKKSHIVLADFRSVLTTLSHYPFSCFFDNLSRYLAAIEFAFSRDKLRMNQPYSL